MIHLLDIFRFRPTPTRWFETYVPREQTVYALEALADTGQVELETDPSFALPLIVDSARETTLQFDRLTGRYGSDFPPYDSSPKYLSGSPEQAGHRSLVVLRKYCADVARLRCREKRRRIALENLSLLLECLCSPGCSSEFLDAFSHKTPFLYKGIFALPKTQPLPPVLRESIDMEVPGEKHDFLLVAALPEKKEEIESSCVNAIKIHCPSWLKGVGDCGEKLNIAHQHADQLKQDILDAETALMELKKEQEPAEALANLTLLRWFVKHAPTLARDQKLCHVAGWTTAEQPSELQDVLDNADISAAIRFPEMFEGVKPPVMGYRSRWAAPFHIFIDMLGTPDNMEIDPSVLLPIIVPLLFGFMFPDIGHGLVLLIVGLVFSAHPKLRMLAPCGLYAIAFGFLFGDFFGRHDVFQALWFHPMEDPVKVLVASLVFGFFLILLGIVFSGIEAYWQGKLRHWAVLESAVLLLYASGLIGVFIPGAWVITIIALLLYMLGIYLVYQGKYLSNLYQGLGALLGGMFELMMNTLSFMRVGVFALAHASMSGVINQLSADVENDYLKILSLVVGHLLVIVIETLIVFLQTTRLVIFEFFIQFLHAEGRVFQPLNLPTTVNGDKHGDDN